jgi:hypothetical protein
LHILYRTTEHKAADGFGPIMFFWIGLSDIGMIICLFDLILAALDQLVARFLFPDHWQQRFVCFYIYQNNLLFFSMKVVGDPVNSSWERQHLKFHEVTTLTVIKAYQLLGTSDLENAIIVRS